MAGKKYNIVATTCIILGLIASVFGWIGFPDGLSGGFVTIFLGYPLILIGIILFIIGLFIKK